MSDNKQDFLKEINEEIGAAMGRAASMPDPSPANRRGLREAQKKKFQMSKKAITWIVVLSLLVVLIGGSAGAYFIMLSSGRRTLAQHIDVGDSAISAPEGAIVADGGETISWNGKTYAKKDSIISILCLGVDKTAEELARDEENGGAVYGNGGQADTVFVAVLDIDTGELTLLNVSRDSMADVDVYNADGEYVGMEEMQICLAYAYGDGGTSSCLNMVKSVSQLMFGVPIDAYGSIDLPAVSILNDAIGGVEVTVLEDLSSRDPSLTEGSQVLLQGNLAEIYVRSRSATELAANSQRMARQRQYVAAFIRKAYSQIRTDWSVALTLYQAVRAYSHTSLRIPQILYLASLAATREFRDQSIITIPGEVTMGEKYAEYHVDDDALFQIILDTYYQEVS